MYDKFIDLSHGWDDFYVVDSTNFIKLTTHENWIPKIQCLNLQNTTQKDNNMTWTITNHLLSQKNRFNCINNQYNT